MATDSWTPTWDGYAVLNPATPMAYLEPSLAVTTTIYGYIVVSCLSIMLWDILQYLPEDYKVVKRRFNMKTLVYVISRLSAFAFLLESALVDTAPIGNCRAVNILGCILFLVNKTFVSLLFYFRVVAVFNRNRYIVGFFTFTWLLVVAGAALTAVATRGDFIGPSQHCIIIVTHDFLFVTAATESFNDMLICAAITWKLAELDQRDIVPSRGGRSWFIWRRVSFERLSERFLQDTQLYLVITFCVKIPEIIAFFVLREKVGSAISICLAFVDTVVVNVMASKVFRNMKLGKPGLLPPRPSNGTVSLSFVREAETSGTDDRFSSVADKTSGREIGSAFV